MEDIMFLVELSHPFSELLLTNWIFSHFFLVWQMKMMYMNSFLLWTQILSEKRRHSISWNIFQERWLSLDSQSDCLMHEVLNMQMRLLSFLPSNEECNVETKYYIYVLYILNYIIHFLQNLYIQNEWGFLLPIFICASMV